MREHPILFSGDMVRAILSGAKKQTRRPVTPVTSLVDGAPGFPWRELDFSDAFVDPGPSPAGNPGPYLKVARPAHESRHRVYPRWFLGDRLWVRETWGGADIFYQSHESDGPPRVVAYRADHQAIQWEAEPPRQIPAYDIEQWNWDCVKWHPSIHMPRWASRLTLEIREVRVERLQDIGGEDAAREGIVVPRCDCEPCMRSATMCPADASAHIEEYATLWDASYAKSAPWSSNPWVWVLSFRRVESAEGKVAAHG